MMNESTKRSENTCQWFPRIQSNKDSTSSVLFDESQEDVENENPAQVTPEKLASKTCRKPFRIQKVEVPIEFASVNKREEDETKESSLGQSSPGVMLEATTFKTCRIQEVEVPIMLASVNRGEEDKMEVNPGEDKTQESSLGQSSPGVMLEATTFKTRRIQEVEVPIMLASVNRGEEDKMEVNPGEDKTQESSFGQSSPGVMLEATTSKTCRKPFRILEVEVPIEFASVNKREEDETKESSLGQSSPGVMLEATTFKTCRIQEVEVPIMLASVNRGEEDKMEVNPGEDKTQESSLGQSSPGVMLEATTSKTCRKRFRIQEVEVPIKFASVSRREEDKMEDSAIPIRHGDVAQADLEADRIWTTVIWNDIMSCGNNKETLVTLNQLKDIFFTQLPNMPIQYISRVLFDSFHQCLVLYRKDKGVIGGICYRPFVERGFIEIVFCAVSSEEQVKGYGKLMMDRLKRYQTEERGIYHFLTFADNLAIGYFRRQGFINERWNSPLYDGCVKSYSGAQLMCWRATKT